MLPGPAANADQTANREPTPDFTGMATNHGDRTTNDPNPFFIAIHDVLAGHETEHELAALQQSDAFADETAANGLQHLQSPSVVVNDLPVVHSAAAAGVHDAAPDPTSQLLASGTIPSATTDAVDAGVSTTATALLLPTPGVVGPPPPPAMARKADDGLVAPASRQRGLAYARQVKNLARSEFKLRRRRELEAAGETERVTRRRRNDTSLSKRGKYLRRLQKNQDSAAAARASNEAYIQCLEDQVERYDPDVQKLGAKLQIVNSQRDNERARHARIVSHHAQLVQAIQNLREATSERPSLPDDPENELGFVRMPNAG